MLRRLSQILAIVIIIMESCSLFGQTLVDVVQVGSAPRRIVLNPVTNKLYVSNWANQSVTVIDAATDITTSVHVPQIDVLGLAVNSVTNKIYVTDDASDTMSVIDGATLSVTSLTVGGDARNVAVNSVTNKIYVPSPLGNVTVVDGATLATTTLNTGGTPDSVAVNPVTNKIYVGDPNSNQVTIIDGQTMGLSTVTIADGGCSAIAVNAATNKIYAMAYTPFGQTVTVIDGATLTTTPVTVGMYPNALAIDSITNKIFVASQVGTVTVIDGATNQTTSIQSGSEPFDVAVNANTHDVFVVNSMSNNLTVINGTTYATSFVNVGADPVAVVANPNNNRAYAVSYADDDVSVVAAASSGQFVPVTPCRLVDTRITGTPIQGGQSQNFVVPQLGGCQIPNTASAYALNVTVAPHGSLGYLTAWPTSQTQPVVSTMNSPDGRTKANAAIVVAGYQGGVSVYASNTTDVILDINGYFTTPGAQTDKFYPLPPCRIIDTRGADGELGGPYLHGGVSRSFPVTESTCLSQVQGIEAYSFNVTAVPHVSGQRLGYLTVWPEGQSQPSVSTLNNPTGTTVANAAIVPAGSGGGISVYPSQDTDLVVDINGYFATTGQNGLSFNPSYPCRVLDTRSNNGQPFQGELTVNVVQSPCMPEPTAQAFIFNTTVIPPGPLGYLTLWPDGEEQPLVSTLNAPDGAVASNMAVVPTNNGFIDAYASGLTQLILDLSGYFAP